MSDKITPEPEFSEQDVEIRQTGECYSGFLKVNLLQLRHRLFGGGWSAPLQREVVVRNPAVSVLLYDPELDMVLLVEQFRVGCLHSHRGPWKLELVAGLIDTNESPEAVATRETREEAGIEIGDLYPICDYYLSPGSSNEFMHLYYARFDAGEAARSPGKVFGLDEENEDIRRVIISREEADKAIVTGLIDNAMSIIALQWLALNLATVRRQLAGGSSPKHEDN